MRIRHVFIVTLLLALALSGPARAVTDAELDRASRQEAYQVEQRHGLYHNPVEQARVERIFRKIVAAAKPTRWRYELRLLNDRDANAFAFPNGMVYVNRGLLDLGVGDHELAFVLGHEVGHVTRQHARHKIEQAQATGVLIGILTGGQDRWVRLLGRVMHSLVASGYSQDAEFQSDQEGLETMVRAGYNPQGALSFFAKLKQVSKEGGIRVFPSHPPTDARVVRVQNWIAAHGGDAPPVATRPAPTPSPVSDDEEPPADDWPSAPPCRPTDQEWPDARPKTVVLRGGLEPRATAPDVRLTDAAGNAWNLGAHLGHGPVLLYFWDARAPISGLALAGLNALARAHPDAQLVAVHSVAGGDAKEAAIGYARRATLRIPVLYDDGEAFEKYCVPGATPQTILIDNGGKVRARYIAFPDTGYLSNAIQGLSDSGRSYPWARGTGYLELSQGTSSELSIAVLPAVAGVTVQVDGKAVGNAPQTIVLAPGRHFVQLVRSGARGAAFTVNVPEGRRLELSVPVY